MKKSLGFITLLILLNGCVESMALLGPVSTSAIGGGNLVQSSITTAASYGVKKQTGKTPTEHVVAYVKKHNPKKDKAKCINFLEASNSEICAAVKKNLSETKEYFKTKAKILEKSKIENLALKSIQKRRR